MGEETIEVGSYSELYWHNNTDVHNHPIEIEYKINKHVHRTKKIRRANSYLHKLIISYKQKCDLEETFWCTNTSTCYHHDYEGATCTTKYTATSPGIGEKNNMYM